MLFCTLLDIYAILKPFICDFIHLMLDLVKD